MCSFEEPEDAVFYRALVKEAREQGKAYTPLLTEEDELALENAPDPVF